MAGDSFFVSDKKRKRPTNKGLNQKQSRPSSSAAPKRKPKDEELSSGSEDDRGDLDALDFTRDDVGVDATRYDSGEEEELNRNETAGEKRIRLAKGYLNKVRDEVANRVDDGTFDAAEIDRELIAARLKQDVVSFVEPLVNCLGPTESNMHGSTLRTNNLVQSIHSCNHDCQLSSPPPLRSRDISSLPSTTTPSQPPTHLPLTYTSPTRVVLSYDTISALCVSLETSLVSRHTDRTERARKSSRPVRDTRAQSTAWRLPRTANMW